VGLSVHPMPNGSGRSLPSPTTLSGSNAHSRSVGRTQNNSSTLRHTGRPGKSFPSHNPPPVCRRDGQGAGDTKSSSRNQRRQFWNACSLWHCAVHGAANRPSQHGPQRQWADGSPRLGFDPRPRQGAPSSEGPPGVSHGRPAWLVAAPTDARGSSHAAQPDQVPSWWKPSTRNAPGPPLASCAGDPQPGYNPPSRSRGRLPRRGQPLTHGT